MYCRVTTLPLIYLFMSVNKLIYTRNNVLDLLLFINRRTINIFYWIHIFIEIRSWTIDHFYGFHFFPILALYLWRINLFYTLIILLGRWAIYRLGRRGARCALGMEA